MCIEPHILVCISLVSICIRSPLTVFFLGFYFTHVFRWLGGESARLRRVFGLRCQERLKTRWCVFGSCRAAPVFPVTSSPPGLTSLTTPGVTTATTTWRGASCLRTSRPGKNQLIVFPPQSVWAWNSNGGVCGVFLLPSLAADSYEWGSQSSGIGAYIGGDDSYTFTPPPPPPEELSPYWADPPPVCFCTVWLTDLPVEDPPPSPTGMGPLCCTLLS